MNVFSWEIFACNCSTTKILEEFYADYILKILSVHRYSALKYHGRRLSDYAYKGQPIPAEKLAPRPVFVHYIKCTGFKPPCVSLGTSSYMAGVLLCLSVVARHVDR